MPMADGAAKAPCPVSPQFTCGVERRRGGGTRAGELFLRRRWGEAPDKDTFMSDFESGHEEQGQSGVLSEEELREPRMYRVLLHNDDYTTMEFVILVLVDIFRKTAEEASEIMLAVHRNGMGVCGVYPREIAEFRVREVEKRARLAGFPLRCTMEEES